MSVSMMGMGSGPDAMLMMLKRDYVGDCCQLAAASIIFYEHTTTFSEEVRLIWGRKLNCVTLLFYVTRWAAFALAISYLLSVFNWHTLPICKAVQLLFDIFQLMIFISWAAFSGLRIYALEGRNWHLAVIASLIGLGSVGTNLYNYSKYNYEFMMVPGSGNVCLAVSGLSQYVQMNVAIACRVCAIASDIIVLLVTWKRTYAMTRAAERVHYRAPLASLMLTNGTLYFLVILALNVLHMAGTITMSFIYTTYFTTPISAILIMRFLLNLRDVANESVNGSAHSDRGPRDGNSSNPTQLSELRFASSFVGNMGAPLDDGAGMSATWVGADD